MHQKDAGKHAPTQDILNTIVTVGIVEPPATGYLSQYLGENEYSQLKEIIYYYVQYDLLAVAEVYQLGQLVGVFPVEKYGMADRDLNKSRQIQTLNTFKKVLTTVINGNRGLQSALVSEGNKLPSYSFVTLNGQEILPKLENARTSPVDKSIDVILQVSGLSIIFVGDDRSKVLVGGDLPFEHNPNLQLKVFLKLLLKSTDVQAQCLGWYASAWEGKRLHASEWAEDDGEQLKASITTAFNTLSHEALSFLFTPSSHPWYSNFHLFHEEVTAPIWSDCSVKDPYKRLLADVSSYCPQADKGIPEFQRRIGNVFYNESHLSRANLVHAYVWYRLAARNNDEIASNRTRLLSSMLTSDELEAAENELNEWKPGQCINMLTQAGIIRSQ
jgi:hypothetical protein